MARHPQPPLGASWRARRGQRRLVDRGHRELPIHPDFTGKKLPTAAEEQVKVYLQEIDGKDAVELVK